MSARRWQRPSWFAVVLTLAGIALFVRLGIWQLDRADEAQRLLAAFDAAPKAAFEEFAAVRSAPPADRYPHVRVRGRFLAERGWLRDEQVRDGKLGVEAYAAFVVEGSEAPSGSGEALLVDRGWIAWSHERGTQPQLPPLPEGETELTGVYAPFPGNGVRVGGNALLRQQAWPKLTLAIDAQEIAADLQRLLLPRVLLLDTDAASGFARSWTPSVMPPERHRGYAVQWFAFAVAAIVIFVLLHFKKSQK
jgi:cytochrome oxidase assembly protein ShyY1